MPTASLGNIGAWSFTIAKIAEAKSCPFCWRIGIKRGKSTIDWEGELGCMKHEVSHLKLVLDESSVLRITIASITDDWTSRNGGMFTYLMLSPREKPAG